MIKIENRQVYSTEGKYIRRVGTDSYFKRSTVLKTDTEADFEEVDELPKYTKEEYNAEVERLIAERYTTGQEIQFAREQSQAGDKYAEYLAYVELCKVKAKENLSHRTEEFPEPPAE